MNWLVGVPCKSGMYPGTSFLSFGAKYNFCKWQSIQWRESRYMALSLSITNCVFICMKVVYLCMLKLLIIASSKSQFYEVSICIDNAWNTWRNPCNKIVRSQLSPCHPIACTVCNVYYLLIFDVARLLAKLNCTYPIMVIKANSYTSIIVLWISDTRMWMFVLQVFNMLVL